MTLAILYARDVRRISLLGIIVGGVTDIAFTNTLLLPIFVFALASDRRIMSLPHAQQQGSLLALLETNPALHATSFASGAFCSILAGYVAAWIAKHDEVLNGAFSSFLCIGLALYAFSHGQFGGPPWLAIALLPLSPALGAAGGYLRQAYRRRAKPTLMPR
jgi:hypothetical protein